jgi:hypothetical protein
MPTITTSYVLTSNLPRFQRRGVNRISDPIPTGKTLIKRGEGDWYCKQYPRQTELEAAVMYFEGGHTFEISDDLADEILANVGAGCMPLFDIAGGPYPSLFTFPSTGLIPA